MVDFYLISTDKFLKKQKSNFDFWMALGTWEITLICLNLLMGFLWPYFLLHILFKPKKYTSEEA